MHQGVRPIRRRPLPSVGLWRDKSGKRGIHGYVSIYRRSVLHPNIKNQMRIPQSGATHKDYKIRREIPQRGTTQPLILRWGFEITSNNEQGLGLWRCFFNGNLLKT